MTRREFTAAEWLARFGHGHPYPITAVGYLRRCCRGDVVTSPGRHECHLPKGWKAEKRYGAVWIITWTGPGPQPGGKL